jgi:hypothetical protein
MRFGNTIPGVGDFRVKSRYAWYPRKTFKLIFSKDVSNGIFKKATLDKTYGFWVWFEHIEITELYIDANINSNIKWHKIALLPYSDVVANKLKG